MPEKNTSSKPLVSIIITTFNRAAMLRDALDGALKQVYENLEIIVSDNSSKDNTEEVVRQYMQKDGRIKYFRNDRNLGAIGNHDIALKKYASGDWVVFVSDDDFLNDGTFVSDSMACIDKYGIDKVAFLQTGVSVLNQDTGETKALFPQIVGDIEVITGEDYFLNFFTYSFFSFTTTIFKREYALRFDIFNDRHYGTDVEMALLIALGKSVILVKKVYGTYRVHRHQAFGGYNLSDIVNKIKIYSTYGYAFQYAVIRGVNRAALVNWLSSAKKGINYMIEENIMYSNEFRKFDNSLKKLLPEKIFSKSFRSLLRIMFIKIVAVPHQLLIYKKYLRGLSVLLFPSTNYWVSTGFEKN